MENSVELLGYYGGDVTHASSAWTSISRDLTDEKKGRIGSMLKMLANSEHETPFEKSYLHFLVTCETASAIHILKHRSISANGESARYKELKDNKYYLPNDWPEDLQETLKAHMGDSYGRYHDALDYLVEKGYDRKRAKESARFFLPYANQTTMDIGLNFRAFTNFQRLRNAPDAQKEIREIAQKMLDLVVDIGDFKYSLEAFGLYSTGASFNGEDAIVTY